MRMYANVCVWCVRVTHLERDAALKLHEVGDVFARSEADVEVVVFQQRSQVRHDAAPSQHAYASVYVCVCARAWFQSSA